MIIKFNCHPIMCLIIYMFSQNLYKSHKTVNTKLNGLCVYQKMLGLVENKINCNLIVHQSRQTQRSSGFTHTHVRCGAARRGVALRTSPSRTCYAIPLCRLSQRHHLQKPFLFCENNTATVERMEWNAFCIANHGQYNTQRLV